VGGRIGINLPTIATTRNDLPVADDHRSDRHLANRFSGIRLLNGKSHERDV
jgi:hypothetical protein